MTQQDFLEFAHPYPFHKVSARFHGPILWARVTVAHFDLETFMVRGHKYVVWAIKNMHILEKGTPKPRLSKLL